MPIPVSESPAPVAAYVRQAEQRTQSLSITLANESFPAPLLLQQPAITNPVTENFNGISNRHANGTYHLVYVNGIGTSVSEAAQAAQVVKRSFGIERSELTVLHNVDEHFCYSTANILGALVSSRLGNRSESESVNALKGMIRHTLQSPHDRLILVGHSQGSLIIQNALDRVYDEYNSSAEGEKTWMRESSRIEVTMYAPIVRTIVPGPEATSLLNSLDLPARGIGGFQRLITASKHYTGWRPQQLVDTIIYSPRRNTLAELALNPSLVHNSIDLILDNVDFNYQILVKDRLTREERGSILAMNLSASIRSGRRSDALHHELIIKGCNNFGASFARPFLQQLSAGFDGNSKCIGRFTISDQRLARLLQSATR